MRPIEETLRLIHELQEIDRQLDQVQRFPDIDSQNQEKMSGLCTARNNLSSKVLKPYLALYERVRAAKAGIGVAEIHNRCCTGCRMVLPQQFVNELQRRQSIEQCPNCKRILYAV